MPDLMTNVADPMTNAADSTTNAAAASTNADIHVCIASGQSLPNLLPVLQLRPSEVWVLCTEAMRAHARHLSDALRSQSVAVTIIPFDDRSFDSMSRAAMDLAPKLDGRPCVLNVTGGTKLMTLAITQVLAHLLEDGTPAPRVLYADTEHQRFEWVSRPATTQPMDAVLRIEPLLLAQGLRSHSDPEAAYRQRDAEQRKELTRFLGDEAKDLFGWFGNMNWLADQALDEGEARSSFQPVHDLGREPRGKEEKALRLAAENALLAWEGGRRIQFRDQAAARYFRGGWLEEFVDAKIRGFRGVDCRRGLVVKHTDSGTRNELDLIAVCRNRVLVVECKTGALRDDKGSDAIYKLKRVAEAVGGRLVTPMLLSARRLPDEPRARARNDGIVLLEAEELKHLPKALDAWVNG